MVWQNYTIEGDKITLTRQEIEEARNHYHAVAKHYEPKKGDVAIYPFFMFYVGKEDILIDLLKMFEPLEVD